METNRKATEKGTSSLPSSSKDRKPENDLKSEEISDYFFAGEKLRCLGQPLLVKGGTISVFTGFWKENGKEREVAARRVKISECTVNWKDIVDKHLTGSLNHDNVLKVFGYEESSDQFRYFALELYGATLEQFCYGQYTGPMPTDAQVLCQIANGINYLHRKDLPHGNLNPQTILISHQGQPVRMKISDFGLRKYVNFPKRAPNDDGTSYSHRGINRSEERDVQTIVRKIRKLAIKGKSEPHSFPIDDDGASYMSPMDVSLDPREITQVSTNAARKHRKNSRSHPGIWMLAGSWSLLADQDGNESIQVNPSVHGDVFAAGCLFFYFLKRGLHPFGDPGTILANITAKNPVNLKKLNQEHFAHKPIKNLISEPPTNGTQWLHNAAEIFQDVLPLKIDENKMIGRGGFGIVYAGTYEGNQVAVKKMPAELAEENRTDFEREMELHKQLDHENVLKLLHVDEEKDPLSKCLVLELCSGTLSQYCDKKNRELEGKPYRGPDLPDLPPDVVVLYQIAIGLDYIHSKDMVHRDIKPDNVLISITKPVHVKLSDFGFCKKVSPQGTFSQSGLKGTLNWMAPEMLEILNDDTDIVPDELIPKGSIESDIFSTGCVFFFFLTRGSHPFGNSTFVPANICNDNPVTLRNAEKKLKNEDHLAQSLYELIGKMIVKEKEERIALMEVIQLLTALVPVNRKFKVIERSFPQLSGWSLSRFHPTDPVLACGSDSSSVILLKAANGSIPFSHWRIELEFKGQTQSLIWTLEWNVNGTQLAAGLRNGTVIVWSYPSGLVLFEEKKHSGTVDLIAWNPFRHNVLATRVYGHDKQELVFWNTRSEKGDAEKANRFLTLKYNDEGIRSVVWISANQIAIGFFNGKIEIWEMDEDKGTSRVVKQFNHSDHWVTVLQWNERTKYLASCSTDKWIKIWSMDSDQPVHTLQLDSSCWELAWRPNLETDNIGGFGTARKAKENFTIACKLTDQSILVYNPLEEIEENKKRILPQKHSRDIWSLSFSPDGRFLASTDYGDELFVWSTETWLPVFTCQNDGSTLSWMSTDSSSVLANKLASRSMDKVLVIEQSSSQDVQAAQRSDTNIPERGKKRRRAETAVAKGKRTKRKITGP